MNTDVNKAGLLLSTLGVIVPESLLADFKIE
jgi:hypothetical protein